ncbi:MAG: hypothetical protein WC806_00590 [Candidatus Gracilibacteria bacterium]|jgi:hypothetical protein
MSKNIEKKIGVIAGNPLIRKSKDGKIAIPETETHLHAFEEAMKFVSGKTKEDIGKIAVIFDHENGGYKKGMDFRKLFCDQEKMAQLSKKKRKRGSLLLSYLPEEIIKPYREIAEKYGVDFDSIRVISEGHCRARIRQVLNSGNDPDFASRVLRPCDEDYCIIDAGNQINCAGITAAALKIVRDGQSIDEIHIFGDRGARFLDKKIHSGVEIAQAKMDVTADIIVHIFSEISAVMKEVEGGKDWKVFETRFNPESSREMFAETAEGFREFIEREEELKRDIKARKAKKTEADANDEQN